MGSFVWGKAEVKNILVKLRHYVKFGISSLTSLHIFKHRQLKTLLSTMYIFRLWCLFFQNKVHSLTYIFVPSQEYPKPLSPEWLNPPKLKITYYLTQNNKINPAPSNSLDLEELGAVVSGLVLMFRSGQRSHLLCARPLKTKGTVQIFL